MGSFAPGNGAEHGFVSAKKKLESFCKSCNSSAKVPEALATRCRKIIARWNHSTKEKHAAKTAMVKTFKMLVDLLLDEDQKTVFRHSCGCKKCDCSTHRCECKKNDRNCTILCKCSVDECKNNKPTEAEGLGKDVIFEKTHNRLTEEAEDPHSTLAGGSKSILKN